jgi:hypothetical protein
MTRALEEESSVAALIEPADESPHENAAYRPPPRPVGETPARTERCNAKCGGYEQARAELTSDLDGLDEIIGAENAPTPSGRSGRWWATHPRKVAA